jgi:hypothetical protein
VSTRFLGHPHKLARPARQAVLQRVEAMVFRVSVDVFFVCFVIALRRKRANQVLEISKIMSPGNLLLVHGKPPVNLRDASDSRTGLFNEGK